MYVHKSTECHYKDNKIRTTRIPLRNKRDFLLYDTLIQTTQTQNKT